jgi:hypothetical protein
MKERDRPSAGSLQVVVARVRPSPTCSLSWRVEVEGGSRYLHGRVGERLKNEPRLCSAGGDYNPCHFHYLSMMCHMEMVETR